jgi:hypothetical protein
MGDAVYLRENKLVDVSSLGTLSRHGFGCQVCRPWIGTSSRMSRVDVPKYRSAIFYTRIPALQININMGLDRV